MNYKYFGEERVEKYYICLRDSRINWNPRDKSLSLTSRIIDTGKFLSQSHASEAAQKKKLHTLEHLDETDFNRFNLRKFLSKTSW